MVWLANSNQRRWNREYYLSCEKCEKTASCQSSDNQLLEYNRRPESAWQLTLIKLTDAEIKRHVNRIKENKAKADTNQQSWRDILRGYIYRADWSKTDFIQNTLLSETVYKRLMGGKEKQLSLKSIVAICLALKIPSDKAQEIIYACGYTFDNSMIHCYYRTFLEECWDFDDANTVLYAGTGESFGKK